MNAPRRSTTTADTQIEPEVHLGPDDLRAGLLADAQVGLTASPKWLPPKYFYDDRGSRLFEEITRLPEYYPTSTERSILADRAAAIVAAAGAEVLVELGSGSSEKTQVLLDAMAAAGSLAAYVPVDVSAGALRDAVPPLRRRYPDLELRPVVADLDRHLDRLPAPGRRMFAILGGTIGNYPPAQRQQLLRRLSATMQPAETLLLGLDLVKGPDRLVAAYDDASGVTAQFNLNVLAVLNRELDADLDPRSFEHVARWDAENEWMEMHLRAREPVRATVGALDLVVELDPGEEIRTEISAKYRREPFTRELADANLTVHGWWTDPAGDYALVLSGPA